MFYPNLYVWCSEWLRSESHRILFAFILSSAHSKDLPLQSSFRSSKFYMHLLSNLIKLCSFWYPFIGFSKESSFKVTDILRFWPQAQNFSFLSRKFCDIKKMLFNIIYMDGQIFLIRSLTHIFQRCVIVEFQFYAQVLWFQENQYSKYGRTDISYEILDTYFSSLCLPDDGMEWMMQRIRIREVQRAS